MIDALRVQLILLPLLIAVLALGCASTMQIAETVARPATRADGAVRVSYYDVFGSSAPELRVSLNRQRSRVVPGEHDGHTRWQVRWRYSFAGSGFNCRLSDYTTNLSTEIFLPRWVKPSDPPANLAGQWSVYLEALRAHEDGHVEIARDAEAAVRASFSNVRPQTSCSELQRQLESRALQVIEEFRAREREYDQLTGHGATQGARFPRPTSQFQPGLR